MMNEIDSYLLDKIFQPIANWVMKECGLSPFRLASNLFMLSGLMYLPVFLKSYSIEDWLSCFLFIMGVSLDVFMAFMVFMRDQQLPSCVMNDFRLRLMNARYICILTSGLMIISLVNILSMKDMLVSVASFVGLVSFSCGLYFSSVEKPPPSEFKHISKDMATI